MEIHQARIEANQLVMMAKLDAHHERTIAKTDAWLEEMKAWRKETTACLESREPTSVETGVRSGA
jgi:hypothetical protein